MTYIRQDFTVVSRSDRLTAVNVGRLVKVRNKVVFVHINRIFGGVEIQLQSSLDPALRMNYQIDNLGALTRWT